MKTFGTHNYYVYITTNPDKHVLYIGVTNDLRARLRQHEEDASNEKKHFAGKYNCVHLVYYEWFDGIEDAIQREKTLKGWKRQRKIDLITSVNPEWRFRTDIESDSDTALTDSSLRSE
ncbi:MAG TPA: GIY-YIG nuclease family protein [Chitinophagales bacterium]|nr:GIY-YIG nuclease family protein [Chitinophagales bacterium]